MIAAVSGSLKTAEGDEYDLRSGERVITDPEVVSWRLNTLLALGFNIDHAEPMAARGDVDVHDVGKWLGQGATHQQVLAIVKPL